LTNEPLYLCLDQGTHASRALVLDARGAVVARELVEVGIRRPREGFVEQDPEELVASLQTAAARAIAGVGEIAAAGLATQRSSIVCWDRDSGAALSPVLSWQDRRAAGWLEGFRDHAATVRAKTGLVLSPHYGASKLRWCLDHLPAVQAARREGRLAFGPLSSFLSMRLCEERPALADPANAARTLLFDLRAFDWDDGLLALFGVPRECLPRCVPSCHEFGRLHIDNRNIPLRLVTGDQSAALFAHGMPRADTAYVNLGTGAFVQRLAAHAPAGLLTGIVHHDSRGPVYVTEGTVNGAGAALAWAARELALPDLEARLDDLLGQSIEPPLFLNGIGGLGAPYWIADFPSRFVGGGTPESRAVAVAESIVFLLVANLERMPGGLARIVVSGGLSVHAGLCQRLADLAGVPVERPGEHEATARGLAFLLARPAQWPPIAAARFEPRSAPALADRYRRWREAMTGALGGFAVSGGVDV
jgi:glycerol kinase